MSFERQPIADHAINLASTIQSNLKRSLEAIGVVRPAALLHTGGHRCRGIVGSEAGKKFRTCCVA